MLSLPSLYVYVEEGGLMIRIVIIMGTISKIGVGGLNIGGRRKMLEIRETV